MQPNEFTDNTDPVGLFEQEYDPIEFLTLASKSTGITTITENSIDWDKVSYKELQDTS